MLCAFIFMMAAVNVPMLKGTYKKGVNDTIGTDSDFTETLMAPQIPVVEVPEDSTGGDSTATDSLRQAIMMHNKIIDDSIRLDSINRKKANGIDAPVEYKLIRSKT